MQHHKTDEDGRAAYMSDCYHNRVASAWNISIDICKVSNLKVDSKATATKLNDGKERKARIRSVSNPVARDWQPISIVEAGV